MMIVQQPLQSSRDEIIVQETSPTSSMSMPAKSCPLAWVERLFERLSGMYGARFADMWAGSDLEAVKAIWSEDLAGYSGEEIRCGIAACKSKAWPPTLPEFLLLCRPVVEAERAWHQARVGAEARKAGEKGVWPNKAIFWAYAEFGAFDLINGAYHVHQKRWQEILEKKMCAECAGQLDVIPEIVPGLPVPQPISREEARKRLCEITEATSLFSFDPLGWAKCPQKYSAKVAIIDCVVRGDSRFVPLLRKHVASGMISVEMARRAKGLFEKPLNPQELPLANILMSA